MSFLEWTESPAFAAADTLGDLAPNFTWRATGRDERVYIASSTGIDIPGLRWLVSVRDRPGGGGGWNADTFDEAKRIAEDYERTHQA